MKEDEKLLDERLKTIIKRLDELNYGILTLEEMVATSIKQKDASDANTLYYVIAVLALTIIANISIALAQYNINDIYVAFGLCAFIFILAIIALINSELTRRKQRNAIDDSNRRLDRMYDVTIERMKELDKEKMQQDKKKEKGNTNKP